MMFHRKKTSKIAGLLGAFAALKAGKSLASLTAAGLGGYALYRYLRPNLAAARA